MKRLKRLVWELSALEGISGFESGLHERMKGLLRPVCDEVFTDPLGSVHGVMHCGRQHAEKLLFDAHMDEIGLMVSKVSEEGFLHFVNIGGVDSRILPGAAVVVHGRELLFGTVAVKPPHIQTAQEMRAAIPISEMVIDIGYGREQAEKLAMPGDMITFAAHPVNLLGKAISGKTMDDRAGVAVLISLAEKLVKQPRNMDVEFLISAQEETGLRGATTGGYASGAAMAVAVDVSHAKTPDAAGDLSVYEFGGGAMIGMGPSMDKGISRQLKALAKAKKIPFQIEVMGGATGTNAWALQTAADGIPSGLVSIPLKYMHTTIETVDMTDIKAVRDLLLAFALAESEKRA